MEDMVYADKSIEDLRAQKTMGIGDDAETHQGGPF
jgi:hypothetical protein